jgi:anaerobic magnesium-protoporphyrin IX monomethyl ester cyclase
MKVLLINPILPGDIKTFANTLPNIGLAYLISAVEQQNSVRLIDTAFHTEDYLKYIRQKTQDYQPDVVGFSTTSFNFQNSLKLARFLRKFYPDPKIPFIWGGVHPTLLPEESLIEPLVDAVCIGEGELAFPEYLLKLQNGQEPYGVAGIWFKNSQGRIIKNPLRPFNQDINSLPMPGWDHFEIDRYMLSGYWGQMGFFASRGCPYQCTFCASPSLGRKIPGQYYRTKDPALLIDEIKTFKNKYFKNHGHMHIYFQDETFGINREHFEEICARLIMDKECANITWSCETRADVITKEWAQLACEARCTLVQLGIESANEEIRNRVYNKNISQESIFSAVQNLRKFRIEVVFLLMQGCYKETQKTVEENLRLVETTQPLTICLFTYHPTPGTKLFEDTEENLKATGISLDKNKLPEPVLPKGVDLCLNKFRMLKVRLFLKHGLRLNGFYFIPRLALALLIWITTLKKNTFNKQYLITLVEKLVIFKQVHAKRLKNESFIN